MAQPVAEYEENETCEDQEEQPGGIEERIRQIVEAAGIPDADTIARLKRIMKL